jgi:hypothetical protein
MLSQMRHVDGGNGNTATGLVAGCGAFPTSEAGRQNRRRSRGGHFSLGRGGYMGRGGIKGSPRRRGASYGTQLTGLCCSNCAHLSCTRGLCLIVLVRHRAQWWQSGCTYPRRCHGGGWLAHIAICRGGHRRKGMRKRLECTTLDSIPRNIDSIPRNGIDKLHLRRGRRCFGPRGKR